MSENELHNLLEHLPGAVYQYQQDSTDRCCFTYCTGALEHLLGVSREELMEEGRQAWRHVDEHHLQRVHDAHAVEPSHAEGIDITFRICLPDGVERWVRDRARISVEAEGPVVWNGFMEDVTEQRRQEETGKRRDAFLNQLFETLPDHLYYKDAEGRLLGANPVTAAHHHRSPQDLIGLTDRELYPGETGEHNWQSEQRIMAEGGILRQREKLKQEDGRIIYLETVKCPLYSPSGRVLGLAGISRDVTEREESVEALRSAKQAAEQSAAFIRAIFDNLDDQFYYKDRQSRVLGGNLAWLRARKADSLENLIGKTDRELHPAPLGQNLYEAEQRQMDDGKVTRMRERHELEDGRIIFYESIKCPMRNEDGEIIGLAGITRDVTEQVVNEQNLTEARHAADAANEAKSLFLAMMSHEIRTPMNGIIGAASLLSSTELDSMQQEFVRTINVSGDNLLTLINDILDYSKIEAGKIQLEHTSFSLRQCVEDCFDLFARAAMKKNLELLHYVDPDIPAALMGDPTRLRQVIINLVGNAVKFTEHGEVSLRAELQAEEGQQPCRIRIAVRDTGIGIPEEQQEHLFQAFTQADASSTRRFGGTGLGLTISRRLVEMMDGSIWFESTAGEGSTFFFEVGLGVSDELMQTRRTTDLTALHGRRVLVVDDNETNCWLLKNQLEVWHVEAELFQTAAEALDHLSSGGPYDLALLDYQMPDIDGRELARKIKALPGSEELPVIMLSSSWETYGEDEAIDAWLSKPVKQRKLMEQMLECLTGLSGDSMKKESLIRIQPRKAYDLRILVAEDNALNRRIITMMLERLGYSDFVIVPDGADAVAACLDAEYDVVLMDVQMGGMDGLEAARLIRKHAQDGEKPWICALSAGVMPEERKAVEEAGMNEFLAKPVAVDQLETALNRIRDRLSHLTERPPETA